MDHDQFKKLYRALGKIGIMVPMVEMINCGVRGTNVLYTRAGRAWVDRTPQRLQRNTMYDIERINDQLREMFGRIISIPGLDCRVLEYNDGLLILEVRRVVDWTTLNHFESSL